MHVIPVHIFTRDHRKQIPLAEEKHYHGKTESWATLLKILGKTGGMFLKHNSLPVFPSSG